MNLTQCIENAITGLGRVSESLSNLKEQVNVLSNNDESFFIFLRSLPQENKPTKLYKTYVIQDVDNRDVKIGKSTIPHKRIPTISKSSGRNLKTIIIFNVDIEKELHNKFSIFRKTGEWFELPESVIKILSNPIFHSIVGKQTKPKMLKELDSMMQQMQPCLNFDG